MPGKSNAIYVQIDIRGSLDQVWRLTQTPDLHQQWDLRFTEIQYLPRPDPAQPQHFLYATRIGFGLEIRGEGRSVGSRDGSDGQLASALTFWSKDRKSLIREGSGYWKYVPAGQAEPSVRFLTLYDYDVRFGLPGRILDRLAFRPLLGWATAWSFDRLRLWIEKGIDPAVSMRRSLIHASARLAVAFVWLYEGVVPKLVFRHADELTMLHSAGLSDVVARRVLVAIGCAEAVLGLMTLLAWRRRWPLGLTLALMPVALAGVAVSSPEFLTATFNPVTFNVSVFALAAIAWLGGADLPSASACVRRPLGDAA